MEQKAYKIFIIEDSDKDRELLEKSLASYNLFQVVGCLPGGSGALALSFSVYILICFLLTWNCRGFPDMRLSISSMTWLCGI